MPFMSNVIKYRKMLICDTFLKLFLFFAVKSNKLARICDFLLSSSHTGQEWCAGV